MATATADNGYATTPATGNGFLSVLWRRKALVIFGMAVGLVAGVLVYLQKEPVYQSAARLVVSKSRADVSGTNADAAGSRVVEDYVSTQEARLRSQVVWERAADKLKGQALHMPPADGNYYGLIESGLKVARDKDTGTGVSNNVLTITFRGPSPTDCQLVVTAIIDAYREILRTAVSGATEDQLGLIIKGRDQTQKSLDDTLIKYQKIHEQIRKASPITVSDLKARINLNQSQHSQLTSEQITISSRLTLIKNGIAKGVDRATLEKLYNLSSNRRDILAAEPRTPDEALFQLKLQEEELLQRVGPGHPDVVAVRRRRALIEDFVKAQQARFGNAVSTQTSNVDPLDLYVQVLEQELQANRLKTDALQQLLDQDRLAVQSLDEYLVKEKIEEDNVQRLRKQLVQYDERKHQIDLTRDQPLFTAELINRPGEGVKVSPVLLTTVAFAGLAGLALGCGMAYLAELSDKSFRSIEEVRNRLGLTVIGQVPALTPYEPSVLEEHPLDPNLVVHHAPKSIQAEAYRGVRTSLYFSTRGKGHQVIQVTSPNPGDGKSTLTANLAASIAQSGKRIALIDCDFRKPRVHKIFGLSKAEVGLASVIAGEAELEQAMYKCAVPGLTIIPCGPRPANPADLLTSALFSEVLDEIKKEFDFVLIDTPPLLAVSDPSVVAPRVDGVILTIRMTKHSRPMAEQARERLQIIGANVIGVVVNGMDDLRQGYGYGYGYGYNYAYAYGEDVQDSSTDLAKSR